MLPAESESERERETQRQRHTPGRRGAARPPAHRPPRAQVQLYREGESGYDAFVVASGQVRKVPYYMYLSYKSPYNSLFK